jgi:hypothetical protein
VGVVRRRLLESLRNGEQSAVGRQAAGKDNAKRADWRSPTTPQPRRCALGRGIKAMSEIVRSSAHAGRAGTSDPDEFQLPVPGLFADLELGRGSVLLSDEFLHCPSLVKLQLLRDWQRSLARYRNDAMTQFAHELTGGSPGLAPGERLALLRSTCENLRIEVPSGFDAMLTEP